MGATLAEIDTEDPNLKAYWNFDSSNALTAGSSEITWKELPTWNAAGYGVSTATNAHPYTQNAGLSVQTGFTVSFDINQAKSGTLFSMTSGGDLTASWRSVSITNTVTTDDATNQTVSTISAQFLGVPDQAISKSLTLEDTDWTTLTLVGSGKIENAKKYFLFSFYVDGNLIGSQEIAGATNFYDDNINKLQFGHYGVANNSASTNIDNILIYNNALSATEVKALTIPEPTTATLSLLALAGLAARRRRASR